MSDYILLPNETTKLPNKQTKVRNYDWKLILKNYVRENNITLTRDYTNEHITRDTKLEGICLECKEQNFCKTIYSLVIPNKGQYSVCLCKRCTEILKVKKRITTNMERYGVKHAAQSQEVQAKSRETCMINLGVEYPGQSQEAKAKSRETCMKNFGVEHPAQSQEVKDKKIETCKERYGVDHPAQSQEVKDKKIETCKERYGVENPFQSQEVQAKSRETCMKNFGVEHPSYSQEIKAKTITTCKEKFGVDHPAQSQEVKDKRIETCKERYGVKHHMQNADIADKSSNNAYKVKPYTFPSGRVDMVQGTEPYALDYLLNVEKIQEDDIVTERSQVPECWWYDENGNEHRYYVDIYIPSQKRCIEAKSTWTLEKNKEIVFKKRDALVNEGYSCEIWVYKDNKKLVEKIM
jgi:hypothetical protein